MNENYLWDKSETDAEIERLENTLQQFRYQKTAPPALPAKIIPFETRKSRRFFDWTLAFAAFAALLIVGLGAWLQFGNNPIDSAKNTSQEIAPILENFVKEIPIEKPAIIFAGKYEAPKQFTEPRFIKARKIVPQIVRPNNSTARTVETIKPQNLTARTIAAKKPAVKLTREEVYAYDQLMLALSITGSKLKLVTDKIENIEKQNSVSETER